MMNTRQIDSESQAMMVKEFGFSSDQYKLHFDGAVEIGQWKSVDYADFVTDDQDNLVAVYFIDFSEICWKVPVSRIN